MPPETTLKTALARAKAACAVGDDAGAFAELRDCLAPSSDYVDQARVAKAMAAIDLHGLGLRPLRLALVAASTMEHLAGPLQYWLALAGFNAEITIAPFDTAMASVLDPASALHRWKPDVVWLFTTHRDVTQIDARRPLWNALKHVLVIENLVDVPVHDPFGNHAGASPTGRRTALRRYNVALTEAASAGVALFDLDHVASCWGKQRWEDARYWFHSRHAFALDASGTVAHAFARLLAGALGVAKKCLVLDLDNTLWGGVIGDDGLGGIRLGSGAEGEAFVAFQTYVKALKDRGVILAACSKNDAETAAAVFRDHPDTVLRLDDFAVFTANWDNKADNIRDIAATLNIGLDALVFVDDNPAERDIVRRHLPDVTVVDLPDDPAGFIGALAEGAWFETIAYSAEDAERSRYYAENARRSAIRSAFVDMDDYLRSLEMVATVGPADPFNLPRMAQLIGKSNQFHLTGTRYTEAELTDLSARPGWFVRRIHLADRFGDNGLIAVVVAQRQERTLFIGTWVMSCRVLGRSVEEFVSNELITIARQAGCDRLAGRYVRSPKNGLVAGLYDRLGFRQTNETPTATEWSIDMSHAGWKTWVRREMPHA